MSTGFSFSGFGQSTPASQSTASTSLFGAPKPANPSLFGTPSTNAPSTSTSATSLGTGLFGSPAATSAPKPTFSFGAPSTPSSAPGTSNLFGTSTSQPVPGGGLFGLTTGQPQASSSLFGSLGGNTASQPAAFGAPQGGTAAPAAPSTTNPAISKTTKLNDLPEAARTAVEGIDSFIRSQITVSNELKQRNLGEEILRTKSLYEQSAAEASAVSNLLAQDGRAVNDLRSKVEVDLEDLTRATAIIEGFKNPQAKGSAAKAAANFPFEFFARKADEFQERISRYRAAMDQVQHQIESARGLERNPAAIVPTLKAQHASFMALASAVAALDLQLKQLKEQYRQVWREKTGSAMDPFKVAKARQGLERGVEHIAIR